MCNNLLNQFYSHKSGFMAVKPVLQVINCVNQADIKVFTQRSCGFMAGLLPWLVTSAFSSFVVCWSSGLDPARIRNEFEF